MKHIIFSIIALLFLNTAVSGQSFAYVEHNLPKLDTFSTGTTHLKKHCLVTRIGEGIMVVGGIAAIYEVVALKMNKNDHAIENITNNALAGVGIFFGGAFLCVLGKEYEKNHNDRFAIIGSSGQVGLAYKF